jgi:hypothetical protein
MKIKPQARELGAGEKPPESGYVYETTGHQRTKAGTSMPCAENQTIEIKAVLQLGSGRGRLREKMLKMKVDPAMSMKTNDGENLLEDDPAMLLKTS